MPFFILKLFNFDEKPVLIVQLILVYLSGNFYFVIFNDVVLFFIKHSLCGIKMTNLMNKYELHFQGYTF